MAHVIISGAGPAGAVLAFNLAARGAQVTLLERHHDFSREFRGEELAPMGRAVLRQLGLNAEIDALPQREIRFTDVYRNGRLAFRVPWAQPSSELEASRFVPQTPLLELLTTEAAARFDRFQLITGVTVRQPLWRDGRVVGVQGDRNGELFEIEGDLVIGCDGRTSALRRKARLDAARSAYEEAFDVVWVRTPPLDDGQGPGLSRLYLAPGRVVLVLPTPVGELQLGTIIEKGSFGEIRHLGTAKWLDHLAEFVSHDIVGSLRQVQDTLKPSLLDVRCFNLDRWHTPGLLLIGDAAHPMSPAGGQGLAQALRDAAVATNELATPLRQDRPDPAALDRAAAGVQALRHDDIDAVQRVQQWVPRILFQRTWYSNVLFGAIGPALGRIAPALLARALDSATGPLRAVDDLRLVPIPA